MAQRNKLVCPSQNGNVAVPECLFDPGYVIGVILIRKGKTFTPEEIVNLRATITTRSRADNRRDRIFVLGRFVGMEDKSTEASTEKYGYGDEVEGDDGRYKLSFQHRLGFCYHQNLLNFNNGQSAFDALLIDNAYTIMGTERVDENGKYVTGGYSLTQIKVPPFKFGDGSKAAAYHIKFAFADTNQFNKGFSSISADFDPFDAAKPLADIKLVDVSPTLPGALLPEGQYAIEMYAGCGSTAIAELYANELALGLFVAKNPDTGAEIPVTAISKAGKKVTLTLDAAAPGYPTLGGAILLTMVAPSALAIAGISGYEAGSVMLTRQK